MVLAGLFFARRDTIRPNYNIIAKRFKLPEWQQPETSDKKKVDDSKPEANPVIVVTQEPDSKAAPSGTVKPLEKQPAVKPAPVTQPKQPAAPAKPAAQTPAQPPAPEKPAAQTPAQPAAPAKPTVQTPAKPAAPEKPTETRARSVYFTQIDRDGVISRAKVSRNIAVSDSPMLDSLNSLLAGPNAEEKNKGMINLIPANTKIRSATVRGNTAYISFSEDFQYNTYGVEGYAAQLRQVVWTATEFPNVNDVQVLIEGRRIDFLGEGIWIGGPVSRDSL